MTTVGSISSRTVTGAGASYAESLDTILYRNEPTPVTGAWVDLPMGGRFRLPTDYGRVETVMEAGLPEIYRWTDPLHGPSSYISSPGGYARWEFMSGNWIYHYNSELGIPNILEPPGFLIMEENESITKSLNKIADQKANMSENLATFGQTVRLLTDPIKGVISLTQKLRADKDIWPLIKQSYRAWARGKVAKKLTDPYLAYVYGVVPLLQDIHGILELAQSQSKQPLLFHGSATARRTYNASDFGKWNPTYDRGEWWTGNSTESRTRTTLWAKLSDEFSGTRVLNQLGLVNPASLVWELVPYSFVIDWLLPVGPVLSALTAPAGLDFVGGSTSRRVRAQWKYDIRHYPGPGGFSQEQYGGGRMRYDGYARKVHTFWPRPGLWIAEDPLGLHRDGSDRVFKALALSISRLPYL